MPWVEARGDKVLLKVWLQPKAARVAVVGIHDDALKITVTSPPVDGRANKQLIKMLSKRLRISAGQINLIAGQNNRRKTLEISGLANQEIQTKLKINQTY